MIKRGMGGAQRWGGHSALDSGLIMQVHGERVLEVPGAGLDQVRDALPGLM